MVSLVGQLLVCSYSVLSTTPTDSKPAAYCGAKAAVISMTRCDAIDVCLPLLLALSPADPCSTVQQGRHPCKLCLPWRNRCANPDLEGTFTAAIDRFIASDTPMTRPRMDVLGPAVSIAPMDRPGTAQEVADCVLFLCSSKASFVQGSALVVDGGYTIN